MELLNGGRKSTVKDDTLLQAHGAGASVHAFKLNKRRLKCPCGCNVFVPEMTGAVCIDVTGDAPPDLIPTGSRFRCLDCKRIAAYDQKQGRWYAYDETEEAKPEDERKPREFMELERL